DARAFDPADRRARLRRARVLRGARRGRGLRSPPRWRRCRAQSRRARARAARCDRLLADVLLSSRASSGPDTDPDRSVLADLLFPDRYVLLQTFDRVAASLERGGAMWARDRDDDRRLTDLEPPRSMHDRRSCVRPAGDDLFADRAQELLGHRLVRF